MNCSVIVASDRRLTPGTKEMGMKLEVQCSWIGVLDSGQILQGPRFLLFLSLKIKWIFPPGLAGATKGREKVYKLCSPVGKYFISTANQHRERPTTTAQQIVCVGPHKSFLLLRKVW